MRFSVWLDATSPWSDTLATARLADDGGWYGAWFADHYMPNTDSAEIVDGPMYEAWSIVAALAAATSRLRLGTLVSPTTVHHPALLANRAASVDRISDGRFVLGLGAGWQINEHRAYGVDLPEPKDRVDRFEEAIQIVRSMLAGGRTTFEGRHFTITDAPCDPSPVQSPLPLLVGTGSNRMMRIAARRADEWNTWGDLEMAGERAARFDSACDAVGRDGGTVHRSVQALVFFTDDSAAAAKFRAASMPGRVIAGTASEILDTIGRYPDLGFDEFILHTAPLGRDLARRHETIARFWAEIATPLSYQKETR